MDHVKKSIILLLIVSLLASCLYGCADSSAQPTEVAQPVATDAPMEEAAPLEVKDYAASVKLDMSSGTAKQEVTVKQFVDGDTTHFNVPSSVFSTGVLKARYAAINTPESTGKIEEYGKKASAFTREKLAEATSIIVESETAEWNPDSTGSRFLVWIWYKTADSGDYRNLNIEILQNGLAIANSTATSRYGSVAMSALNQAKEQKVNIYSGQKDPDFYYGEAIELTLKELRTNIEAYSGMKVAFSGIITKNNASTIYIEDYDSETDMYYGMAVYYGYNLNGTGLEIIGVGNEARIVGTVQYYEAGGTYQVSDLNYRMMKPDDPNNIQLISEGNEPAFILTDPNTFVNGEVTVVLEEGTITESYAALAMNTSLEMQNLYVADAYTTTNESSSSKGAMTLYCRAGGVSVTVRTTVLHDADGNLITEDAYVGRTINVRGIVDYFSGDYQIKVFSAKDITIVN